MVLRSAVEAWWWIPHPTVVDPHRETPSCGVNRELVRTVLVRDRWLGLAPGWFTNIQNTPHARATTTGMDSTIYTASTKENACWMTHAYPDKCHFYLPEEGRWHLELQIEALAQAYLRNGLLVTSLGLVLFYSAHDVFHRYCAAAMMLWGMWLLTGITASHRRRYARLGLTPPTPARFTAVGWVTAALVAVFLTVEHQRGSLWAVPVRV